MKPAAPNINHLWAQLLVEELVRHGVTRFCIAPGSRSAPLALAVAANRAAQATIHFDERGAAFFALGCARATRRPAAVITTSGSAVANLLPAVVEASRDLVPLLVITADRPPELRDANANQTIDQVKLFGSHARWFVDMPCPDPRVSPAYVLTTVAQAVLRARTGPVHINCMFREPLAPVRDGLNMKAYLKPIESWLRGTTPWTSIDVATKVSDGSALSVLEKARRGVVVVGPGTHGPNLARLLASLNWPVLPDIQSGLRFGKGVISFADAVTGSSAFTSRHQPDVVLHLGGRMTSKRVAHYLATCKAKDYIVVDHGAERPDATHRATRHVTAGIEQVRRKPATKWLKDWLRANDAASAAIAGALKELSEPYVARAVSELTPAGHGLFLGSSMPVRDMDLVASDRSRVRNIAANRGASGIDGTLASAAGFAAGLDKPVTVLLGDLALLHDLNSLALLKELKQPVTIVVVNNDGGGIFSFLPIAETSGHFEKYFGTPHGLTFKDAAAMFGLPYVAPERIASFRASYAASMKAGRSSIIEVRTLRDENRTLHESLLRHIARAVV